MDRVLYSSIRVLVKDTGFSSGLATLICRRCEFLLSLVEDDQKSCWVVGSCVGGLSVLCWLTH